MLEYFLLPLYLGFAVAQSVDQRLIGYYVDEDTTVTATCHSTPSYSISWFTVASETGGCRRVDPDGSSASFWGVECTENSGKPAYIFTGINRSGGSVVDAFSAIQMCGSGCGTLTVIDAAPNASPDVVKAADSVLYVTCVDDFPSDAALTLFRSPSEKTAEQTAEKTAEKTAESTGGETDKSLSEDERNSGQGLGSDQNDDEDQGSNAGLIAGAIVGSLAGLGLIIGAFLLGRRMALRKNSPVGKAEDGGGSIGASELGDDGLRVRMPDSSMPAELSSQPPFINELEAGDVSLQVQVQQPGGVSPATSYPGTTSQEVSPTSLEGQTTPTPGPSNGGVARAVVPDDGELAQWQSHRETGVGHHGR